MLAAAVTAALAFSPTAPVPSFSHAASASRAATAATHARRALAGAVLMAATTEKVELTSVPAVGEGPMRPLPTDLGWKDIRGRIAENFGLSDEALSKYDDVSKEDLLKAYEMMQLSRQFENACNQAYMQGNIRGFMHLDNGQETIPAMLADTINKGDKKVSYYREHTHALASGVSPDAIMAELFAKDGGTCRGTGGSMHIYDKETNFQGGWALVCEQLPYAAGAARSILLDRALEPDKFAEDDRVSVVFIGDGGAQNGRMAETLNAAAKEKLPLLFIVIDNGRAINTFTPDVATNSDVWAQGKHYGVPGVSVDGTNMADTLKAGRAVMDYVRTQGPAILQVHTYRFQGHSPADPEHERGRKDEKRWARAECDPIKIFEASADAEGLDLGSATKAVKARVKQSLDFARDSPPPPRDLAKELEYPDVPSTDYNARGPSENAEAITKATVDPEALANVNKYIGELQDLAKKVESHPNPIVSHTSHAHLFPHVTRPFVPHAIRPFVPHATRPFSPRVTLPFFPHATPHVAPHVAPHVSSASPDPSHHISLTRPISPICQSPFFPYKKQGEISIADSVNLACLEEMVRDPRTLMHAEDLQAGSSYNIPKLTQQTFGTLRAADEIIDEGHFIGKALGEGMNGYRPIVELMNTNFGIYAMAEISSAGNTYATTGGQFEMPMTIIGAGGTAPNQALGAEHSQPFHAYVMGIPGLKIGTASSPEAAYGITKSMIRDNGPCFLFLPVKMMKETKGYCELGVCAPMHKCQLLHKASDESIAKRKAVTVLTYLHGVKEAKSIIEEIQADGMDMELIELTSLKPLDMETIRASIARTNKVAILDESTQSGGVGATVSAVISEQCFDLLDAPVKRLCMDDAPVPYAASMEQAVVKRGSDLALGIFELTHKKF